MAWPVTKRVFSRAAALVGQSFHAAGDVFWPDAVGLGLEELQDGVGYSTDTSASGTVFGRLLSLEAVRGYSDGFTSTVPLLNQRVISQPGGCRMGLSIASSKLVIAQSLGNDGNLREVFTMPELGLIADAEIKTRLEAVGMGLTAWDSAGAVQVGHMHRMRTDRWNSYHAQANGGSTTTVSVAGTPWATNQWRQDPVAWRQAYVRVTGGTNANAHARIVSNTNNTLTFEPAMASACDSTTIFEIYEEMVSGVSLTNAIFFSSPDTWQLTAWDGGACFKTQTSINLGAAMRTSGVLKALPWGLKSRVRDRTLDFAWWQIGVDPEPNYGDAGVSGSYTIPNDYAEQAGEHGYYAGHMVNGSGTQQNVTIDTLVGTRI